MSFESGKRQKENRLLVEQTKVALLAAHFLALPHVELYSIDIPQNASYEKRLSLKQ